MSELTPQEQRIIAWYRIQHTLKKLLVGTLLLTGNRALLIRVFRLCQKIKDQS